VARLATHKEAADARKKKKAEVAHRKYKKEKEVARRVKARERKSDVESELESEDPTNVDDMVFSEEEESRDVVVTSVERRDREATSSGDEQEAARRMVVPTPRKHGVSVVAISEWEAKRTRSPRPWWRRRSYRRLWRMRPGKPGSPRSRPALVHCRD